MYEHVRDLYDNMIVRLLRRDCAGPKKEVARHRNTHTRQSSMGITLLEMSQNTVGVNPFKQTTRGGIAH